jgi:hypothetical protein
MTEQNTGWQPEELRQLACDAVKHLKEERDALQARCDKLEAAARLLLRDPDDHDGENIRWVREFDLNALRSVVDGGE